MEEVTIEVKVGRHTGVPQLIVRVGDKEIARVMISLCDAKLLLNAQKNGLVPRTGYVQDTPPTNFGYTPTKPAEPAAARRPEPA